MQLSEHDQKILDDMEKEFEEMTGEKPTHVFIDVQKCDICEPYHPKGICAPMQPIGSCVKCGH